MLPWASSDEKGSQERIQMLDVILQKRPGELMINLAVTGSKIQCQTHKNILYSSGSIEGKKTRCCCVN